MIKETNGNKSLESKIGWKCPFPLHELDKNTSSRQMVCKGCGTIFETTKNSNYCRECDKIFYDEP